MKDEFIARVRQEQTNHQLELVCTAIDIELKDLIAQDTSGLHQTQLAAVSAILNVAAEELRTHVKDIPLATLEVEEVYDLCRDYDEAIVWLQRLWEYLHEKFGQRNESNGNEKLARLLKSADEVVWSCFHGVLNKALGQHGSAPLTYVEPEYSPATIQTDQPLPVNLTLTTDLDFLNQCLESLPIPVLRLPPACISAPWWLVFVGHEVGHHVQYALDVVGHFREGMSATAQAQGFSKEEANASWGRWGEEIFADFFSLLMMGQWALRAMAEAETGTAVKMVKRKLTYPSPVIRLSLMKHTAETLGLDTEEALLGLDLKEIADTDPVSSKDYKVVEGAVSFALQPLPGQLGSLAALCSFDKAVFADGGKINGWGSTLTSKEELPVDRKTMSQLETARYVACGSLRAWSRHSRTESGKPETDDLKRQEKRERIRSRTIDVLMQSGPRETRAGGKDENVEPEKMGKTLADLLRKAASRSPLEETQGGKGAV